MNPRCSICSLPVTKGMLHELTGDNFAFYRWDERFVSSLAAVHFECMPVQSWRYYQDGAKWGRQGTLSGFAVIGARSVAAPEMAVQQ